MAKSTTTTTNPFGGVVMTPTGSSNPLGVTADDNLKISGVGSLLRLNWGDVTVAQAVNGLTQLAQAAQGNSYGAQQAKTDLANIQHELYIAGYYGTKAPKYGTLSGGGLDLTAFRKAMVDAAHSGVKAGDFLTGQATNSQQSGSAGTTTVYPAQRVQQTVYSPDDIQAAIEGATTATGENLAQKLIGKNFTHDQLQAVADMLNQATGAKAQADVQGIVATQQQDITTKAGTVAANATQGAAGTLSPAQIEQLWIQAGGDPSVAPTAAAIALAESGGNPASNNPNDNGGKQTSWGLFQISNGTHNQPVGNINDPLVNAQQAVAKYNAAKGFSPWGTYTSGAYKSFQAQVGSTVPQTGAASTSASSGGAGVASPVGSGLKQGRTDQGVDFSGKGAINAVGSGTIINTATNDPGGFGTVYIALRLDNPVDPQHSIVYYAEDIAPGVQVGQHVTAGQQIGQATGGSSGIEIGWANPANIKQPLAQVTGGAGGGAATGAGQHFASYIGGATVTGAAPAGAQGQNTQIYQTPVVDQIPNVPNATDAATVYAETQDPKDYQTNNLLNVFDVIASKFGPNAAPSSNVHVRGTPLAMK